MPRPSVWVTFWASTVFSITGGVLTLLGVGRLDTMPSGMVCHDKGFSEWDCSSVNQTIFYDDFAPPCCIGASNETNSWVTDPLDDLANIVNHVDCRDIGASARTGVPITQPLPEGQTYDADTLDEFESLAVQGCVKARLESGFYSLYLTGPLVLLACLVGAVAWLGGYAVAVPVAVALVASAMAMAMTSNNVLLRIQETHLSYKRRIMCAGLPQRFVSEGVYLGAFSCADVTRGGVIEESQTFAYVNENMDIFFAGTIFSCVGVLGLAALLGCTSLRARQPLGSLTAGSLAGGGGGGAGGASGGGYHSAGGSRYERSELRAALVTGGSRGYR